MMIPALQFISNALDVSLQLRLPQLVLVVVAELLEDSCSCLCSWLLIVRDGVCVEMVLYDVCHSLCVCCGSRPTAPDGIGHLCELVRDTIGDVGSSGGSAVSS